MARNVMAAQAAIHDASNGDRPTSQPDGDACRDV